MKPLHIEALKLLKQDIEKYKNFLVSNQSLLSEYTTILEDLKSVHIDIETDKNMKADIKYIKLNESISDIQKILYKIDQLSINVKNETDKIDKRKDILMDQIYQSYPDKKKVDLNNEVDNFMSI